MKHFSIARSLGTNKICVRNFTRVSGNSEWVENDAPAFSNCVCGNCTDSNSDSKKEG